MGSVETRQGVIELRDEAFRLANTLMREAVLTGTQSLSLDAATKLQSVAYMLGEVERSLVGPELREVEERLTAA